MIQQISIANDEFVKSIMQDNIIFKPNMGEILRGIK